MGLAGLPAAGVGDAVTITLDDGRRLRGTVAWAAGDRAGLRFSEPLAPDDRLLCA
jgi:hypothetical protein